MSTQQIETRDGSKAIYRICVGGRLDDRWADYFGCMPLHMEYAEDERPSTTWVCEFVDQAALFGALRRLNGLGLQLLSVEYIDK